MPPTGVKADLQRLGLRPRKGLGQNFLRDERFVRRIVEAAELSPADQVIEVGPGLGILTRELVARAGRVVAVELDRALAEALKSSLAASATPADSAPAASAQATRLTVVNADVLDLDPAELAGGQPYKVVANLPYYVSSPVLRHFLERARVRPTLLVVTLQREVAERIVAHPGDMSLLAVSVQLYGSPRIVAIVPAQAFYPTPKVDSAVVRIDVYPQPAVDVPAEKLFRVVQAGFSQARKQLHNAISQRLWLPRDAAPEILRAAGVDPTRRPQTLSLEEWAAICRELIGREHL